MRVEIESGIVESKNLRVYAACLQMGWLGTSRGRRRVVLSFGGGAMTLVVCFTMVLVATTPHHLLWPTAYLWEFDGSTFSGSIGAAPVALYAWHGTESLQARSDRAETGLIPLIGRSPTDSVDTFRIHTHRRGRGGSIGLGNGGGMGREGERDLGFRAFEQRTVSRARKRALLRSV